MMENESILVFGAGCIGRGLLGELAVRSRRAIVYAEINDDLAHTMTKAGEFTVFLAGKEKDRVRVTDYTVGSPADKEWITTALQNCVLAATAVGGAHLEQVAKVLALSGACLRGPLPVLVCENLPHAGTVLHEYLSRMDVPENLYICISASVERMVRPIHGSLDVVGESGETAVIGGPYSDTITAVLKGVETCEDLTPFYYRKLFTNNAGHALLAYEGHRKGYETLYQSVQNPQIADRLTCFLSAARQALEVAYGLDHSRLDRHIKNLIDYRYANKELGDTVERVGRQPIRKLGPNERLVGLLRLLVRYALPIQPVCRTIAAAMRYYHPHDDESILLQRIIREKGPDEVLQNICRIGKDESAYQLCIDEWKHFQ